MEKPKNCAYRFTKRYEMSENRIDQRESQKIYAYIAHMSSNAESPRRSYGDSSQLTYWILDSGATCHMTP